MEGLLSDGLILPSVVLVLAAFGVPRILARVLPEGVVPLLVNAFVSTVLLFVLSALLFVWLYLGQELDIATLTAQGLTRNIVFFGRLGIAAAIIWAPVMILSLSGLPRKWVNATW